MATVISQRELRNDNADVMRRVEQGETFVVTRNGVPVADLVPHQPAGRRRFVPARDVAAGLTGLGAWGVTEFERERTGLDQLLDDTDLDRWAVPEDPPE